MAAWGTTPTTSSSQTAATGQTSAANAAATATPSQPQQITGATVFSDLPKQGQDQIVFIEKSLREHQAVVEEVRKHLKEPRKELTADVNDLSTKLSDSMSTLEGHYDSMKQFRRVVMDELKNAARAVQVVKRLISGTFTASYDDLEVPNYFLRLQATFEPRIASVRQQIDELQQHLNASIQPQPTAKMLQDIITSQHQFFMMVASRVASLHESVEVLKELYCQMVARRDPTAKPFDEARRRREQHSLLKRTEHSLTEKKSTAIAKAKQEAGVKPGTTGTTGTTANPFATGGGTTANPFATGGGTTANPFATGGGTTANPFATGGGTTASANPFAPTTGGTTASANPFAATTGGGTTAAANPFAATTGGGSNPFAAGGGANAAANPFAATTGGGTNAAANPFAATTGGTTASSPWTVM